MHLSRYLPITFAALLLGSCGGQPQYHTDVLVVGAGIAGLSAALEAADNGADVIVIDMNSVGGGHAVKAGGLALVGTQLQKDKGIEDSAELAAADLMAWGEDTDNETVRRYAEQSSTEVYEWLVGLGVEFKLILPTPESSVARFHFTKGTALHVVLPMMREALSRPNIRFFWNTAAQQLLLDDTAAVSGIAIENLRTGSHYDIFAPAVVLATGGYQSDIDTVLDNWPEGRPKPAQLLIGSGEHATGSGYQLAASANAHLQRMTKQVTFVNGIPDPRNPQRGLTLENRFGVLINKSGRQFIDAKAPAKHKELAVFRDAPNGHWMILDSNTLRKTIVRGSAWLTPDTIRTEILENKEIMAAEESLEAIANAIDVPAVNLNNTIDDHNLTAPKPLSKPPYFAIRMHPLTRKSLGGPATDDDGQVITPSQDTISGLFAAGELTGVAGINGSFGGSGTFLGPSVWQGRIAGRAAAGEAKVRRPDGLSATITRTDKLLIEADGYWHYKQAHDLINERGTDCQTCHNLTPMAEVASNADMLARLNTCTQCH